MKRHLRRTSVRVVLVVMTAFGAVLWTVDAVWSMQEPGEVARMSKQMKTVCVGRFLIDLPATAQVSIGSAAIDGFNVVNYGNETPDQFATRVARREEEINAEKNVAGLRNMESVTEVHHDHVHGKIFVFNHQSSYYLSNGKKIPTSSVSIHGYAHVNGTSLGFVTTDYNSDNASSLARLLTQLQPLARDAIPTEPGFCLDGAFLRDPLTADQGERIVMFAGLPGHPDLGIALSTMAGTTPGPGLLERNRENRAGPYAFLNLLTSTLLEGRRTIGGIEGDEFAFKARERNFTTGYVFDWETEGTEDDVLHPFVSLELQTGISPHAGGEPVQSTLSEASLGDLWRRMSASLRLRPVVQPVARDADLQLGLALGTLAWAGETCTQSGWWDCGQADARVGVLGGARQFLRAGQVVPQALLLPRPSVWQKVRGLQPSYEAAAPTAWRLADKRLQARHAAPPGLAAPGPGAMAVPEAPGVSVAGTGQTRRSGEACPASGWWRCLDDQALDGTRWFAHGATLPPASYRLRAGATQRRAGQGQLVTRQGAWQLMRAAGAAAQA